MAQEVLEHALGLDARKLVVGDIGLGDASEKMAVWTINPQLGCHESYIEAGSAVAPFKTSDVAISRDLCQILQSDAMYI